MALGYILSLIILAVSFILLVVVGLLAAKKIKPTLNHLKETQEVVNDHVEHFTNEADAVQNKVNHIVERIETLQQEAEVRVESFEELSTHASHLGEAISHLNNQRNDITKGIAKNAFEEIKTDGPKLVKTFQLAIKRTIEKQKARKNGQQASPLD